LLMAVWQICQLSRCPSRASVGANTDYPMATHPVRTDTQCRATCRYLRTCSSLWTTRRTRSVHRRAEVCRRRSCIAWSAWLRADLYPSSKL
jgi:hypothetical protein